MVSCGQTLNLSSSSTSLNSTTLQQHNNSTTSLQTQISSPGSWTPGDTPDAPPQQHGQERPPGPGHEHYPVAAGAGLPRTPLGPGIIRGVSRGSIVRHHGPGPEFGQFMPRPMPIRPPFFIREIYKNGFLKRLPYNERKSSALAKLMKSDRYWVVFSIHDDVHPFLELWHEPTEVATKPPVYIFPLAAVHHISPTLIPADSEWSFVINFETIAIRFSCNSREVMDDWVDIIRNKLGEMGILNPKGNLYSRTPLGPPVTKPVIRDPTSPLPQPPEATSSSTSEQLDTSSVPSSISVNTSIKSSETEDISTSSTLGAKPKRGSVIDTNAGQNQTFTTSIYLSQQKSEQEGKSSLIVNRKTSLPVTFPVKRKVSPSKAVSASPDDHVATSSSAVSISSVAAPVSTGAGATSSVYLNQSSPTRHVTVIPINNDELEEKTAAISLDDEPSAIEHDNLAATDMADYENRTYGAIFDFDEKTISRVNTEQKTKTAVSSSVARENSISPRKPDKPDNKDVSPRRGRSRQQKVTEPPPLPDRNSAVARRLSDRRHEVMEGRANIQQKIRRKSRRSSSLGPLLDGNIIAGADIGASTLSLESVDSNPRQALARSDKNLGAVPRRPGHSVHSSHTNENPPSPTHPLVGGAVRPMTELPPGIRPPPYHPLASLSGHNIGPPGHATGAGHSGHTGTAFPPMIPLPGLTCQMSVPPCPVSLPPVPADERGHTRSLREQQVFRLRQEISHPAGVRLQLRKKDVQSSLALVDLFGCVWVVGWKQRDYPVLFNAFHIGDQIISVSGVLIRTSSEFSKLVKLKSADLHTEIIIRRAPFGQVFYLKPDIEGQSLGILLNNSSSEIKEIIPGSVASQAGVSAKVRSFDGQTVVPLVITEINGRPLNLFNKEGETWERLSGITRDPNKDISVLLQPADIVSKYKKQLKSVRSYKDYLLG